MIECEHTVNWTRWRDHKARHVSSPDVRKSLSSSVCHIFRGLKNKTQAGKHVKWRRVEKTRSTPARETGDRERAQKLSNYSEWCHRQTGSGSSWGCLPGVGGWVPTSGNGWTILELGFRNQLRHKVPSWRSVFPKNLLWARLSVKIERQHNDALFMIS